MSVLRTPASANAPDATTTPAATGPHGTSIRFDRRAATDAAWEPLVASVTPRDQSLPAQTRPSMGAAAWLAPWTPGGDALVIVAALAAVVLALHAPPFPRDTAEFLAMRVTVRNTLVVAFVVAWGTTVLGLVGAYDAARTASTRDLLATTVAGCVVAALPVLLLIPDHGRWAPIMPGLLFLVGATGGVLACRVATYGARRLRRPDVRVIIAGTGPRARALWAQLRADSTVNYRLIAVADTPEALVAHGERPHPLSDGADGVVSVAVQHLDDYLMRTLVDEVFVALPHRSCFGEVHDVLLSCERAGVRAHHLADVTTSTISRPRAGSSGGFPAVRLEVTPDESRLAYKRIVDVLGATTGLVLLAPVLLAIAVAVRSSGPGPVLFAQERYGYRKRRFRMLKFRTMVADAERRQADLEALNEAAGPVFKIARDPRVTRIGAFLRRSSLDELPQLWNVLRGEMSLVGPRPLPTRDVARFTEPWLMRRFSVRPGLTCLWQISGRSNISFDEWVALDLRYIDEWSLALDCRILLRTLPAVLTGHGAR